MVEMVRWIIKDEFGRHKRWEKSGPAFSRRE
jgi:hypothetical protein